MSTRSFLLAIALSGPALGMAQVSTTTASLAQISLTGTDLNPNDAFVPLAFDMSDLIFSYTLFDRFGENTNVVTQSAAIPYAMTSVQGPGSTVMVNNSGVGSIAMAGAATGSGAVARGNGQIRNDSLAPLVINPYTRYTLSFSYFAAQASSGYDGSSAQASVTASMVLVRPGMAPVVSLPGSFITGGNSQGLHQMVITNDSDIAGTLALGLAVNSSAYAGIVPEPQSTAMWLMGLAAVIGTARRPLRRNERCAGRTVGPRA